MTTAERLLARLRQAGLGLPEGSRLVRVYPSRAMRNEGAWSWAALGPGDHELRIGSQYSMAVLLAAEALYVTSIASGAIGQDTEVLPAKVCGKCGTATLSGCQVCRAWLCRRCFTDHYHEG